MAAKKKKRSSPLTSASRTFIVQRLACFATCTEVANEVSKTFGIKITASNVQKYDYTKAAGANCARKWVELYDHTRDAFLKHIEKHIPESNKAVRVDHLARASRTYRSNEDFANMADMFERIAKEMGNVHSNRREFTGKGGGPIKLQEIDLMTEEQIDAELRAHGVDPDALVHRTT